MDLLYDMPSLVVQLHKRRKIIMSVG